MQVPKPPKVEKVSELILDAYYYLLRKQPDGLGDREVLIQQCKVASSYTVKENGVEHRVPDRSTMFFYNHFWATETNNQAMEIFDIYGPILIPEFD